MLNENFVIVGAVIATLGSLTYIVKTLKGQVKPNKVTFFLWSVIPLVAFTAEIKQGVGIQSLMTLMVGILPLIIFFASFVNKNAYWKLTRFDIYCGVLSLCGIFLWYITGVGNLAIVMSIITDGLAALPTVAKAYKYPETEASVNYFAVAINALLTLLTIRVWNFAHFGFPLYIFILTLIIFSLVQFKLGKIIATKAITLRG